MNLPKHKMGGIYKIINNETGQFYVGSSTDLRRRARAHRNQLRKSKHPNPHLQNAWNKYGEDAFEFVVIETCDPENVLDIEQSYLDAFANSNSTYNIATNSYSGMGGRYHTKEAIAKIAEASRNQKFSEETKAAMSKRRRESRGSRCIVDGIIFDSKVEAIETLELPVNTFYNRMRSKNFPTYYDIGREDGREYDY